MTENIEGKIEGFLSFPRASRNARAQVAAVLAKSATNADAQFLLRCIDALPPRTMSPPSLSRGGVEKVLELLGERFRERAGIEVWEKLASDGLLSSSVTHYVKFLCRRINFTERMGAKFDERADNIANALRDQLLPAREATTRHQGAKNSASKRKRGRDADDKRGKRANSDSTSEVSVTQSIDEQRTRRVIF